MTRYTISQDGSHDPDLTGLDAESVATFLRAQAAFLERDAKYLRHAAGSIANYADSMVFPYEMPLSFLSLCIERD